MLYTLKSTLNIIRKDIFGIFLFFRLLSVLLVQTWYVPDEYWQSLEVAHNIAFGYGYLTWEWVKGIRSYFYPLVIAFTYRILKLMHMDTAAVLIYLPRILQAVLSSYADYRFYIWCNKQKWAAFSIITSWFWFYMSSRTLINTLETCLTTIALSYFPWPGRHPHVRSFSSFRYTYLQGSNSFLWIVALVCAIRPTAAIQWLPLCIYHLIISKNKILSVLKSYLLIGITVFLLSVAIDSCQHGSIIVTNYKFLKLNVFDSVGEQYGILPWNWYLSTGFPAIVGIYFVPFVIATVDIVRNKELYQNELALLGCIVFTIFLYSLLPHKEFRFILPVLPIALKISSQYLSRWSYKADPFIVWICTGVLIIGNVVPAIYLSFVHQRGTLDVMIPLRQIAKHSPTNTSILFLMPCHSTPLYSHIHVNVTTRFLTCEPNFNKSDSYIDEADIFYNNPYLWLRNHYPPNKLLPSHLVLFDSLIPSVIDLLSRYEMTHKIFHTNVPSGRVGSYVTIHQRIDF